VIREWANLLGFVAILILGVAWIGLLSLDLRDRRHGGSRSRSIPSFGADRRRPSGMTHRSSSLGRSGLPTMGRSGGFSGGSMLPVGGRDALGGTGTGVGGLRMVPRPRKGFGFVPASIAEAAERRQIVLLGLLGSAVVTLAATFLISRTVFVLHAFTDGALAAFGDVWVQRERAVSARAARRTADAQLGDIEFEPFAQEA
jgi:hypothetical protein